VVRLAIVDRDPALQRTLEGIARGPHRLSVEALAALLGDGEHPVPAAEVPERCAALTAQPAPSTNFDRVVVMPEAIEPLPPPAIFSDHPPPQSFLNCTGRTPEVSVYTVRSGTIAMSPTLEVVLDDGGDPVPEVTAAPFLAPLYRELESAPLRGRVLVVGTPGARMFSHWLFDVLPRIEAARLAGYGPDDFDTVLVQSAESRFTRETLELLGFRPEQIAYGRGFALLRADELVVPTAVRELKYTPAWARRFLRRLFLGDAAETSCATTPKVVYISRQDAHRRRILGHDLIEPFLEATGAVTLKPETCSVAQVAAELSDAALLLGPHGAGLANAVFLPPEAAGLEMMGTVIWTEYYQLIAAGSAAYALVTGVDDHDRDVLDPASLEAHTPLPPRDLQTMDIRLHHDRTRQALAWATEALQSF
jgi:hypothetical protein